MSTWLRDKGVIANQPIAANEMSRTDVILQEYEDWLRDERGLAPSTIKAYAGYVNRFLTTVCDIDEPQLAVVRANQVSDYIRRNAPRG